jgi:uncharacterized membrane protein YeaQ/YmgE (transglycosylase-associated protein family)
MTWLITLLAIGLVAGWLASSFTERRGMGLIASLVTATIGSVIGGFGFGLIGARLVGEGPLYLASILAAAIGAIISLVVVGLIKK